ncbi:cupin domain-containing protein [Pseudoalteromonas sp. MMG013]|uniref:Cupin 2 domain-containing protein n=1 Tax=Pseudoalteromonas aurantia 208 TaxID=1314867 RepID=A0ABR9E9D2_9GAMM|nr:MULTISPECIES: cupin domain-containing protein [Pseudoalteromonas]MBE0367601.1 cupin 2 domain-containing protein [Pseudoalteromonas aurantia 208]MBQ4845961.1 cupin domain-containing protein [Pseudoalteromonas sp. MMG005]MBQ4851132.1 cupin domain-containing protein [Pseudoalteromonas sp. MMG012]MBQ4863033.1 cupin domain-containing protein [Pseudoalteromonas sp. MMG013]
MNNLLSQLPINTTKEHFEELIATKQTRIERIVSFGQTSPNSGWYNQTEHEWVMVLEGSGTIEFECGQSVTLNKGDYLNIPAHTKHKVSHTALNQATVWLAVFYA